MFEAYVVERRGHDALEDVMDAVAGRLITTEPFIGPGSYPSDDLLALVDAEAAAEAVPRAVVLRELGRFGFPRVAQRYPWIVAGHRSLSAFLSHLRRAASALTDVELALELGPPLRIAYGSLPGICALAEGLLEGAACHFKASVQLTHVACVDRGDPRCVWEGIAA